MSQAKYRAQAADVRARMLEGLDQAPSEVVAMVAPVAEAAERALAHVEGRDSGRTALPEAWQAFVRGSMPVARTMHRCDCPRDATCDCVQSYPTLDGAPVGRPESLEASRRETEARRNELAWLRQQAHAASSPATTARKAARNAKRAAARSARNARG